MKSHSITVFAMPMQTDDSIKWITDKRLNLKEVIYTCGIECSTIRLPSVSITRPYNHRRRKSYKEFFTLPFLPLFNRYIINLVKGYVLYNNN